MNDIDERIQALVITLNEIDSVKTISSCGGHKDKQYEWQADEGHFYISFSIDRYSFGFEALDIIAGAIGDLELTGDCHLSAWSGGSDETVLFELRGGPETCPDALARRINTLWELNLPMNASERLVARMKYLR